VDTRLLCSVDGFKMGRLAAYASASLLSMRCVSQVRGPPRATAGPGIVPFVLHFADAHQHAPRVLRARCTLRAETMQAGSGAPIFVSPMRMACAPGCDSHPGRGPRPGASDLNMRIADGRPCVRRTQLAPWSVRGTGCGGVNSICAFPRHAVLTPGCNSHAVGAVSAAVFDLRVGDAGSARDSQPACYLDT